MEVLALDLGDRWVGVAVGERASRLAFARPALTRSSDAQLVAEIQSLVQSEGVATVVLGHPKTLGGESSEQTASTEVFAKRLHEALAVPVELVDERLSSVAARRTHSGDGEHSEAARLILESYLNRNAVD